MEVEFYTTTPLEGDLHCMDPKHTQHNSCLYVPAWHVYRHTCPSCGETYTLYSDEFYNWRDHGWVYKE